MQIPPASITSIASGAIGSTANAQRMQSAAPSTEAASVTTKDVAELSHGDADRDAQGQGDGLPAKRGHKHPKQVADTEETEENSPTSPPVESGGLDLWG